MGHGDVQQLQDVPVDGLCGDDALRHSHNEQAAAYAGHGEFHEQFIIAGSFSFKNRSLINFLSHSTSEKPTSFTFCAFEYLI